MYRQSPNRNQRSKRIKVKYVLQICLLLAVCFWLIYQVKHSHDKKKEFEESDANDSSQKEKGDEIINLGRKGIIRPRDDETTSTNNKPIEEEETIEEDENKPEEDEPDEKNVEENLDDDEQENLDREEDSVDESENQEVDSDDGHGQTEKGSVSDENGDDKSTHEAREEHYKADDASSAVTHDAQTDMREDNTEETNTGDDGKDLEVENGEIGGDDGKSNVTTSKTKVDVLDGSENGPPPNKAVIEESDRDLMINSSAEVKIENGDLSQTKPEMDQDSQAISSERTNNSILNAELKSADFTNSSGNYNAESLPMENITTSESSVVAGNKTESSSEKNNEIVTEKSDYENSESTVTENLVEEVQHDGIDVSDTSNSMEEKHVRTDLDTLPEIQTEGTNSEDDVAAE